MATLQWEAPDTLWDHIKLAAKLISEPIGALLTGNYHYVFNNYTDRTVKMHLSEDDAKSFFLTLPANTQNVEIPMRAQMVAITAGFYNRTEGCFEIFWTRRRFAWKPNVIVSVLERHSTEANELRSDVTPRAPLVLRGLKDKDANVFSSRRVVELDASPRSPALLYMRDHGQWRATAVTHTLPGGLLCLEDGKNASQTLDPEQQPTLVPADEEEGPCGEAQQTASRLPSPEPEAMAATVWVPSSSLPKAQRQQTGVWLPSSVPTDRSVRSSLGRPDRSAGVSLPAPFPTSRLDSQQVQRVALEDQQTRVGVDKPDVKLGSAEYACPPPTRMRRSLTPESMPTLSTIRSPGHNCHPGDKFVVGQSVEVYSISQASWVPASVKQVHADGSLTLQYVQCDAWKTLRPDEQASLLRTI